MHATYIRTYVRTYVGICKSVEIRNLRPADSVLLRRGQDQRKRDQAAREAKEKEAETIKESFRVFRISPRSADLLIAMWSKMLEADEPI